MSFAVKFTEASRNDLSKLDGSQRVQILKSLTKIEANGMKTGQPLHGNLWDCRKLKHKRLGLRVVFRQSSLGVEIVEIVVVGKREDSEVYAEAAKRLGRM